MGPFLVGSDVVLVFFRHIPRLFVILCEVKADLEHRLARLACGLLHVLDDHVMTAQLNGGEVTAGLCVVVISRF